MRHLRLNPLLLAALAACGGGDSGPAISSDWAPLQNICATPRTGKDPLTGDTFPDKQGTLNDEKSFLRAYINDLYLWYKEVPNVNPDAYATSVDYFTALRTPALLPSGLPKDKTAFHFTYATATWESIEMSIEAGYGVTWATVTPTPPRLVLAAFVEPGSPADMAGIARGDEVLTVDGVDVVNGSDVATLNNGLFPDADGQSHTFSIKSSGAVTAHTVTMSSSASVQSNPVLNVKTIPTATGLVGYFQFNEFVNLSEMELSAAITQLKAAGITDLVMDMRYNGGGLLGVASELGFMVAGQTATNGKTFELLQWNDKHQTEDPVAMQPIQPLPFSSSAIGYSLTAGVALPSLNLPRVFMLVSGGTASASEAVINSLQGIDIQVILVGTTTIGKPYGFYPMDNCGTTYFAVEFQGVNNKGFGAFPDGFTPGGTGPEGVPGCIVQDDYSHTLGDPAEHMLATALNYRANGSCVTTAAAKRFSSHGVDLTAVNATVYHKPTADNPAPPMKLQ